LKIANAKATFTEVFDMRKFPYAHENTECVKIDVGSQSAGAINIYVKKHVGAASEPESICGWRLSHAEFKGALASGLAGTGRLDEALVVLDDATAIARENGHGWYAP
jgi:hypothetical protein